MPLFLLAFFLLLSCTQPKKVSERHLKISENEAQFLERKFRAVTLENGLQVLLVSDPNVKKSAAAMSVDVGWLSDPVEHMGMAHFVEHLLFISTEKYPEVGGYMKFINSNGGRNNAYTFFDHTNYMLEIKNEGFPEGLDRFAQFFISPTFDPKYVQREKKAIDNEFSLRKENDWSRANRVLGLLSDPKSNFKTFSVGSSKTLADTKAQDARDFHERYYSANLMRLAVISPLPLGELEKLVRPIFTPIKNTNAKAPVYPRRTYVATDGPRHIELKSLGDRRDLLILFNVPNLRDYVDSKPHEVLDYILSYQGPNSLSSRLSEMGLATEVSGWVSGFADNGVAGLYVNLTEQGIKNVDKVTSEFFGYIEKIKDVGYPKYIFTEQSNIRRTQFEYRDLQEGFDYIKELAAHMLHSKPLEVFQDQILISKYSEKDFEKFLSAIRPEKMTRMLIHKKAKVDKKGPHFGMEYSVRPVEPPKIAGKDPYDFPAPNQFAFSYDQAKVSEKNLSKMPTPVNPDKSQLVALHRDPDFLNPKAQVRFSILSRAFSKTPRDFAIANLYLRSLAESLREWESPMSKMGMNITYQVEPWGLQIDLSGFTPKMKGAFGYFVEHLKKITLTESQFANLRKTYQMDVANKKFDKAWTIAHNLRRNLISSDYVDHRFYEKEIPTISLADVNEFATRAFNKVRLVTAAHGQLEPDALSDMAGLIYQKLGAERATLDEIPNPYIFDMGGKNLAISEVGAQSLNSWTTIMFPDAEPEDRIKYHAAVTVYSGVFDREMFSELRTKKQLGYYVSLWGGISKGVPLLHFSIHSNDIRPRKLEAEAMKWFESTFGKGRLEPQLFERAKASSIDKLVNVPIDRGKRFGNLWNAVWQHSGDFTYNQRLAEEIKKMSMKQLFERMRKFSASSADRATAYVAAKGARAAKVSLPMKQVKDFQKHRAKYLK